MLRFILRRLLQMVLAFFGTTLIVYALMFAGQGDPIQALAGERPVTAGPAGLPDGEVPPRRDRRRRLLLPLLRLREEPAPGRPRAVADRPADRRHPRRRLAGHRQARADRDGRGDHLRGHRRRHRRHPPRRHLRQLDAGADPAGARHPDHRAGAAGPVLPRRASGSSSRPPPAPTRPSTRCCCPASCSARCRWPPRCG